MDEVVVHQNDYRVVVWQHAAEDVSVEKPSISEVVEAATSDACHLALDVEDQVD